MKKDYRQIYNRSDNKITIHEVVYDESGKILNWSKEPMSLSGKSTVEVELLGRRILNATKTPILEVDCNNSHSLVIALRNPIRSEWESLMDFLELPKDKDKFGLKSYRNGSVYLEMALSESGLNVSLRSDNHEYYSHSLIKITFNNRNMLFYDIIIEPSLAEKMNVDEHIQVINWLDGDYIYSILKSDEIKNYIKEISLKFQG